MSKKKESKEQSKTTDSAGKKSSPRDRTKQAGRLPGFIRFLQRYVGNSRLQSIQADQGVRMPQPAVQRALPSARSVEGEGDVSPEVEQAIQRARGGGQPLDSGEQQDLCARRGSRRDQIPSSLRCCMGRKLTALPRRSSLCECGGEHALHA